MWTPKKEEPDQEPDLKKLSNNLDKALDKETPESLNAFLDKQPEQEREEKQPFGEKLLVAIVETICNIRNTDLEKSRKGVNTLIQKKERLFASELNSILSQLQFIELNQVEQVKQPEQIEDKKTAEEILNKNNCSRLTVLYDKYGNQLDGDNIIDWMEMAILKILEMN